MKTTNGKRGGNLEGKPHNDKEGNPVGGIKAVITDAGRKPVELEGGEVIINKEASKKHWRELSRINQSAGNGVPIQKPVDPLDDDPEDYEEGGRIIEFNRNHIPSKWILNYAKKIKSKHPEIWKLGGNIYGNTAFENLQRVVERGYWLDSEKWMYIKWRSYVARHKQDFRIEGVVAMLKWVDKVDKGWKYMKDLIEENIKKKADKPKSMKRGGSVAPKAPTEKELQNRWDKKISAVGELANNISSLRYSLTKDLKSDDEKTRLTALVISIIDNTGERVGNEESADNGHFGVTGFKKNHIKVVGNTIGLSYIGKSGVDHETSFTNENIANGLKEAKKNSPSEFIFTTKDGFKIKSDRVNRYLEEFNVSAKDLRGYCANKWIVERLSKVNPEDNETSRKKQFSQILSKVAEKIGHGKATLRTHYLLPDVELNFVSSGKVVDIKKLGGNLVSNVKAAADKKKKEIKRDITEDVLFETRQKVKLKSEKNSLRHAEELVDNQYKGGGRVVKNKAKIVKAKDNDSIVEFYETTPQHAKECGIEAQKPLYLQTITVSKLRSRNEIGNNLFQKVNEYAKKHGNDVIFGHIPKSESFTEGSFLSDAQLIKYWLHNNGYTINEKKNHFHKVVQFEKGGLIAPNGNKSNLTAEQYKLVRTPAFKAWFGDWENSPETASKIVDENGEPMVVYHGTNSEFNVFKIGRAGGIFFSNKIEEAKRFSEGDLKRNGEKTKVVEAFINLRNEYSKTTNDEKVVDAYYKSFFEKRPFITKASQKSILKDKFTKYFLDLVSFGIVSEEPLNVALSHGYDGIVMNADNSSKSFVVFSSNQIKLADGSNTTFDTNNPDIRFEDGGNINSALVALDKAPSVKYWMQPEFVSETYDYEKKGKSNSFAKVYDKKNDADTIIAYDSNGDIVGLFTISKSGKEQGAFKIVVREDSLNSGCGKKLLDEAQKQGIDVIGNIKNNSFSSSGRELLRSWLKKKTKQSGEIDLSGKIGSIDVFNKMIKAEYLPTWKMEYGADNLRDINEMVARQYLNAIAEKYFGKVDEIEFANWSKKPTNHFQFRMYLGNYILWTSPFIHVDDNHNVIIGKTNIEVLDENYDVVKKNIRFESGGNIDFKKGGNLIKRADGSYSKRGLWDNIRANAGSGKEPTEQMLQQEAKIKGFPMKRGGIAGDVFSLKDRNQFTQIMTVYNELCEKHGVKDIFVDNNSNSIVFILNGRASDVQKKAIEDYVSQLKNKSFDIIDAQSIEWGSDTISDYFKLKVKGILKYADGGSVGFENVLFDELADHDAPSFGEGGNIEGSESFMKWYVQWYKTVSGKMNIAISLPSVLAPFKESNVVVLDLFEKIKQNIDAKPYLNEIINKADQLGVTIYLEPSPRHRYFLANKAKRDKITKEYLVSYYQKFGFKLTNDGKFMKRTPSTKDNPPSSKDVGEVKLSTYQQRITSNLKQMDAPQSQWSAVPINGFTDVDADGSIKAMPEFSFPKGYAKAPTLFPNNSSGSMNCELCGRMPIKTAFYIQNDKKKLLMLVGSECVTHFGEGVSGKQNVRQFKLNQAEILNNDLRKAASYIKDNFSEVVKERLYNGGTRTKRSWKQTYLIKAYDQFYKQSISELATTGKLNALQSKKAHRKDYIFWYEIFDKIKPFDSTFLQENRTDGNAQILSWYKRGKEKNEELLKAIDLFAKAFDGTSLEFDSLQIVEE